MFIGPWHVQNHLVKNHFFCSFARHLRDSYLSLKMTLEKLLINGCKLIFGFKETIKNTISNKLDFRILSMTKLRQ